MKYRLHLYFNDKVSIFRIKRIRKAMSLVYLVYDKYAGKTPNKESTWLVDSAGFMGSHELVCSVESLVDQYKSPYIGP